LNDGDKILKGCILYYEEDGFKIPSRCVLKGIDWEANWKEEK
jgi:hypothetical protein